MSILQYDKYVEVRYRLKIDTLIVTFSISNKAIENMTLSIEGHNITLNSREKIHFFNGLKKDIKGLLSIVKLGLLKDMCKEEKKVHEVMITLET